MISVEEARRLIQAQVAPVAAQAMPLLAAMGRVVASPVTATFPLPPFDTSDVAGFAVCSADLAGTKGAAVALPIAPAQVGRPGRLPGLKPGHAARVAAGMPLPAGADAVVPWDEAGEPGLTVSLPAAVEAGARVRRAGDDVPRGARILEAGQTLTASRVALLASLGRATALVYAPLRVAVVTTDDLAEPGTSVVPGKCFDGNAYALMAAVVEAGGQPFHIRALDDGGEPLERALPRALQCDVVIVSGGSSRAGFARLAALLTGSGQVYFTEVAQQPGKAFLFATVRGTPVFAMSGDPIATALGFDLYIRPALRRMMGHASQDRPRVLAIASETWQKPVGRQAFLRALVRKAGPAYHVRLAGPPGAGILSPAATANAWLVVPAACAGFAPGDVLETMLLEAPELCGMACLPVGRPEDALSSAGL